MLIYCYLFLEYFVRAWFRTLVFCAYADILTLLKLHDADEDVIDGAVCIFKAVIFKIDHSSGSTVSDTRQLDAVLPMLLHLLDELDGIARAAAMLIAEYCSMYPPYTFYFF